jgi:hypothetical protein
MIDGGVQTAVVMLLVATSALLGSYLTEIQAPQNLAKAVSDLTTNQYFVLALLNVVFLLLGMFLHSAAAIILVVPVVMPLVTAAGIDPLHRQGQRVGRHQGQHLFHRRAVRAADAGHLRAGHRPGTGTTVLSIEGTCATLSLFKARPGSLPWR